MHDSGMVRVARVSVRGVRYHMTQRGKGAPVMLLHGFTESNKTWHPLALKLCATWQLLCPDLLGHGQSDKPEAAERYALPETAADMFALADAIGWDRFHLIGYSMGGRVAQHMAVAKPERLLSLTLISSSPGMASRTARKERQMHDNALADMIQTKGTREFVNYWEALPLFASERELPAAVRDAIQRERLANDATGLANSLRGAGVGTQQYLLPALIRLTLPTLLLTGERDTKYVELAAEMAAAWPAATAVTMGGVGHAVHREQPLAVAESIAQFLHGRTKAT